MTGECGNKKAIERQEKIQIGTEKHKDEKWEMRVNNWLMRE